ncbi:outer membrane beta-barrel protein [Helicobacter saguini]|uniref:Outer membrane beta-barrel protein n=1 Tax=Helicobacter saguini TaxID=1548018 RepID=A0A347VNA9_9HELI|nr:outer membrane beta-barrel protein [Helicobacter saguini]MWV61836.1 outer membrane beta-barrel protein [Helicobacter saguini]MWV67489.1 outer membrane beta-barrel protein [Helicobacter saguini]MWV69840.1 outer membrane beta-barrel protein [Helicobacter saguini]MWV72942.1 outer membrane beta-barrel protein [Helicobacter saguini]TLD95674.1 outer membrane beta-barrel protein [Helicobacter saguini]
MFFSIYYKRISTRIHAMYPQEYSYPQRYAPKNYDDTHKYSDALLAYGAKKTGALLGIEYVMLDVDSTLKGNLGTSYNVKGNMNGFGLRAGYQRFFMPVIGTRTYVAFKYMRASLNDDTHKLGQTNITLNGDILFDLPFNFTKPSSGFGVIIGVALGAANYYDSVYNLPWGFNIGVNLGVNFHIAARHRLEMLMQWLIPLKDPTLAEYSKSHILATTYSAESFTFKNLSLGFGYTINF